MLVQVVAVSGLSVRVHARTHTHTHTYFRHIPAAKDNDLVFSVLTDCIV